MEVRMKRILVAGLFAAIGTLAMISQANATSRYCFANPDDPRCFEPGYADRDFFSPDNSYEDDGTYLRRRRPDFESQYVAPRRNSCKSLTKVLRRSGFKLPYPIDCSGRNYTYVAFRDGQRLKLIVASSNGRIRSIQPY
jgi:hypothetical protein